MEPELRRLATFANWDCFSPPTLARMGFYYSGALDTVICSGCGKHCTASGDAWHHRCSAFSYSPSVHGAANDYIQLGHGSLTLPASDTISSSTFHTSGSVVSGISAGMGIEAEGIQPRHVAVPSGGMTSAFNGIGDVALDSQLTSAAESARLATFSRWLGTTTANISPLRLAKNGFFYSGYGEMIICCACKMHCTIGDHPLQQHELWSPGCSFVPGAASDNFPYDQLAFPVGIGTLMLSCDEAESVLESSTPDDMLGSNPGSHYPETAAIQVSDDMLGPNPGSHHPGTAGIQVSDMLGPNPGSHHPGTAGIQVEDDQQPQVTAVDALMDCEEIKIVLRFISHHYGFSRDDLKALVAERLNRGEECLIPTVLLDAVFKKYMFEF